MRLANEIITVINRRYDSGTGYDVYKAKIISGVSWYSTTAVNANVNGLNAADAYIIRFPQNTLSGYVEPIDYAESGEGWTLKNGDILVKGSISGEITPSVIQKSHFEYVTIKGITDNRRAPNAPHIKVTGT